MGESRKIIKRENKIMNNKIKKHYKEIYSSAPISISEKDIDFIIKHECKCCYCGESVFNLDDYPIIVKEEDELLCEDCYYEEYSSVCNLCENYYITRDFEANYFVLNKEFEDYHGIKRGIYKVLKRPFYFGSILSGFAALFSDSIEFTKDCENTDNNGFICDECENRVLKFKK